MVKHIIHLSLLTLLLKTFSFAEKESFCIQVQQKGGHPKLSNTIQIGERFEILKDITIKTKKAILGFKKGLVGWRFAESDFFIAEGMVAIEKVTPQKQYGYKTAKPILRFSRGTLNPKSGEILCILPNSEIRWVKRIHTDRNHIIIDGLRYAMQFERFLIANQTSTSILEWKEKEYTIQKLYKPSATDILVSNKVIRDTGRNISFRPTFIDEQIDPINHLKERTHYREQARRYAGIK